MVRLNSRLLTHIRKILMFNLLFESIQTLYFNYKEFFFRMLNRHVVDASLVIFWIPKATIHQKTKKMSLIPEEGYIYTPLFI